MFVRSMLPTAQDAAEVMQDVAVVLWERFERYDESRDFRAWAFGVARFQALMYLRKARNDRHVFEESLAERLATVAQEASSVHERQREALQRCLRKLTPNQRELVLEAYSPGARIDKLAEQRGQTAMSLYKMLHRIRMLLFGCVNEILERGSAYE